MTAVPTLPDPKAGARGSSRGRPRRLDEPERRRRVIEAAESVFVSQGYSAASVDDIASHAGMSKKTLYRLYRTKEAMFAAVIAARRQALTERLETEACGQGRDPAAVLRRFLSQVASFVLARRQAALYRLVIAESQRAPELACAFYREGPSKARLALKQWLTEQCRSGTLCIADPDMAASMLFSMVIGEPQMRLLIGEMHEPDAAALDDRIGAAVQLFLEGTVPRQR